ncbi:DNA polymerase III subunit gamma/tau [Deinococcus cavernae]|uniref:DNA polymerase III subunit gamma/tau n=1 Tax=Deinococcus cavernae TaxID=2320857 RepID=A0A418V7P4_9DEIO|nr:DNA polymerase III subunit gamma/tau [Deinococcus cavernae]RJF72128.1 DNA polymerase III subunit gamma/tau [Deinococcus cavernae]
MSAIYQRARPIRWEDIVGQEHVKDVLRAALSQGRVGHAYLFSGPRGVGKTTTARLIAMTANCLSDGPKPCGECESCLAVRAGSHPDVLEIDAASNNSVDDVRDLREKVGLAAMRGGKKIYILDEAHMMSRAAFNALLKTLEEPPGHVIFILATTEPEKIIPTILSRCQHYRFRRLTPEEIAGKLAGLADKEGVNADADALNLIGRLADGAMRDGESLLERMLAAGTAITRASVEEALGLPPGERVRGIAGALVVGDAGAALSGAAGLYRDGFAARTVVEGLVAAFGAALHAELGLGEEGRLEGADVPRLLKLQAALDEQESRFARSADQQSLELSLTHALLAADAVSSAGHHAPAPAGAAVPADLLQRLNRLEKELATLRQGGRPAPAGPAVADFDPAGRRSGGATGPTPVREAVAQATEGMVPAAPLQGSWVDVVRQASMQVKAYLKPARQHAEPGYVSLTYDDRNKFHAKQLAGKFDDVAKLVLKVFGPVTFELVAPDNLGRRQNLGGPGGAGGGGGIPAPAPTPAPPPVPAAARRPVEAAAPVGEAVPDFDPAPRRAASPRPVPASSAPVGHTPNLDAAAPAPAGLPPKRPAVATLERPSAGTPDFPELDLPFGDAPEQRVPPHSPDDVAPAPLPDHPPAPWNAETPADPPPAPADAQGGDRIAPPTTTRELYVVEAITEEPDWGDIGGGLQEAGPPSLDDAPFAEYSAPRPPPQTRPASAPQRAPAAPSRPGDIRAHPLYDEVKSRFSGRVREIGKNRNYQPPETDDASPEEAEGTEAEA